MVLAGGAARRMGGAKAVAELAGRPLVAWALDALRDAGLADLAIAAKRDTPLPRPPGAPVWVEPDEPRHPLAGIAHALGRAAGRDVVCLPVDLPLTPPAVLGELARLELGGGACAAVVRAGGRIQPLVARFAPAAAARLTPEGRATEAVLALDPLVLDAPAEGFLNVNAPEDLERAEAELRLRPGRR